VIFTEVDAQTAATFFSELKALNGGHLIAVIGADPTLDPTWFKTVAKVVGTKALSRLYSAENPVGATGGAAWTLYDKALLASKSQVPNAAAYATDGVAQSRYNGANLVALAMLASKSTKPTIFNPYIVQLAKPKPGAVKVYSFAQGKRALLAGRQIQYIGLGLGIAFDRWHNSPGQIEIDHFLPNAGVAKVPDALDITAPEINAVAKG